MQTTARAGAGQPDRRTHRLQRRVRAARRDRPLHDGRRTSETIAGRPSMRPTSARPTPSSSVRSRERPPWADYVRGVVTAAPDPRNANLDRERRSTRRRPLVVRRARGRRRQGPLRPARQELALLRNARKTCSSACSAESWISSLALARAGHALLLDCRDLSHRHIPVPTEVCDRRLRQPGRTPAGGLRLQRTPRSVRDRGRLGVRALRDTNLEDLEALPAPCSDARDTSSARTSGRSQRPTRSSRRPRNSRRA